MKFKKKILTNLRVIASLAILAFFTGMYLTQQIRSFNTTSGSTGQTLNPGADVKPLRINNRTESFEVVDVERTGQRVRLSLRNKYNKNITAFSISAESYKISSDYNPDKGISPGETIEKSFTLPPASHNPKEIEQRVIILAVVFDDGTGEGDTNIIREILDERLGEKRQMTRMLPYLKGVFNSSDSDIKAALDAAKSAITNLSIGGEGEYSFHFRAGLHNAKENALKDLEQLEVIRQTLGEKALREELGRINQQYNKKAAMPE